MTPPNLLFNDWVRFTSQNVEIRYTFTFMATHTINQNQLRPSGSFIFPDMANSDRMPKRRGNSKLRSQRAKDNSKLTILVLKLRNLTDMFDVFISHS